MNYLPEIVAEKLDDMNQGDFLFELEFDECSLFVSGFMERESEKPAVVIGNCSALFEDETLIELNDESISEIVEQFNEIYN